MAPRQPRKKGRKKRIKGFTYANRGPGRARLKEPIASTNSQVYQPKQVYQEVNNDK